MNDSIHYLGLTHKTAPLGIRERLRPDAEQQTRLLQGLSARSQGRLLLATCERFEIYASPSFDPARCLAQLACEFGVCEDELNRWVKMLHGREAAHHLLRVAAGLESRILGEAQILAQVRDAYTHALELGCLGPELSALSRAAIHAGKLVRSQTSLSCGGRSIASLVLHWLIPLIDLRGAHVAILGSGSLARVMLRELAPQRPHRLTVVGRTPQRCQVLAQEFRAHTAPLEGLADVLINSDVLIGCAAANAFLVRSSDLPADGKHRYLIDLAVPRNIEPTPSCAASHIRMTHLDELVASQPRSEHDLTAAERIIEGELERFADWQRARKARAVLEQITRSAPPFPLGSLQRRQRHLFIQSIKAEVAA